MRLTVLTATFTFLLWGAPAFANGDFDGDNVGDVIDNCSQEPNPSLDDTDLDDCGNLCDADYDNDGFVGILDFGQFVNAYLTNDEEKIHEDGAVAGGTVGLLDFGFFGGAYLSVPGPSGTTSGTIACP